MFGNFIYLIIALLISSSYFPPEKPNFSGLDTAFLGLFLASSLALSAWIKFQGIEKRIGIEDFSVLDDRFNSVLAKLSVLALGLFAINIHGLNLTSYISRLPLVSGFPTLETLLSLALYLLYLVIVWSCAWFPYKKLYQNISIGYYLTSQISFSIPVVLPWVMISGLSDIIYSLPFEFLKKFLSTSSGQILVFLTFLFTVVVIGPALIQKFWRCKPLEKGIVRERIENLSRRAGLKFANIVYWPIFGGRMITAGVMGMVKNFRYLMVTEALLQYLNLDEIDAVVAHEIAHIKKKHLLFYLFFFAGYMVISYTLLDLVLIATLYFPHIYKMVENVHSYQTTVTSAFFGLATVLSFLIYFRYVFGYFMRNFERQADAFIFNLFESPIPLITTLQKIAFASGQPADKPNWHHYSISERILFLQACEKDRSNIMRHDRKIKKSIAVYGICLLLIGAVGYSLNWGETGKRLNSHLFEKVLLREIDKNPNNPVFFSILGDMYAMRKKHEMAKNAYEKAILLQPDNYSALNNLAWILATSPKEESRDPERAVILALKAVELKPTAQIMDTLAESLYASGKFEEAVIIGEKALHLASGDRTYFEAQLEKFRQAN